MLRRRVLEFEFALGISEVDCRQGKRVGVAELRRVGARAGMERKGDLTPLQFPRPPAVQGVVFWGLHVAKSGISAELPTVAGERAECVSFTTLPTGRPLGSVRLIFLLGVGAVVVTSGGGGGPVGTRWHGVEFSAPAGRIDTDDVRSCSEDLKQDSSTEY
ncbi:Hypothetical protein SMAX5B_001983 [Scophthalmus maximus]|uniref:Uncharacterized protein n=1 Tax=Scophthalmus maximus TaxID=52904 RepID=A0A2U9CWS0_SCOMX|nr:Hypothetical protein SMAX5B_001983 [Scophthalmus maximus]